MAKDKLNPTQKWFVLSLDKEDLLYIIERMDKASFDKVDIWVVWTSVNDIRFYINTPEWDLLYNK